MTTTINHKSNDNERHLETVRGKTHDQWVEYGRSIMRIKRDPSMRQRISCKNSLNLKEKGSFICMAGIGHRPR